MQTVRTVSELRGALDQAIVEKLASGQIEAGMPTVGMVPTMGALHEGHLSLVGAAKQNNDIVVMSVFVNPTQFNDSADLAKYPRNDLRDAELAEQAGVDILFMPTPEEMYPEGYATTVTVAGPLTKTLEGAHRGRGHFDGVATVVAKLLITVLPDNAYFGQKDAQQLLVVKRMVKDLRIPTAIVSCPIVREDDGLAMSSRNVRLSEDERQRALALSRSLFAVQDSFENGVSDVNDLKARAFDILADARIEPEYLAFVDPETLEPVERVDGEALCAIAAPVGPVRLIDNVMLGSRASKE